MARRTKIVCTLGPASESPAALRALARAGMDVARINFSHGAHDDHARYIENARAAAAAEGRILAILADLQGPKLRVGDIAAGQADLVAGRPFILTGRAVAGDDTAVHLPHPELLAALRPGDAILLDDGLLELRVRQNDGTDVLCDVIAGGALLPRKGISVPRAAPALPAITEKDRRDLAFALSLDVDYIAQSFVRQAGDVAALRALIAAAGQDTPIIAKIEKPEAVENVEAILAEADGVMVARGDLGVEMPAESLESMVDNPMPTRAEASDVANAIIDGADAIMLSGETATGNYPEEAVAVMSKISEDVERFVLRNRQNLTKSFNPIHMVADGLCYATTHTAIDIGAKLIVTYTESGRTALLISKYRPSLPIMAITVSDKISRRINLYWGVLPATISRVTSLEEVMMRSEETAIASGMVKNGDHILITAGIPFGKAGSTNIMKIQKITFVPEEASADAVKAFKTKRISMFECAENKLKLSFDRALCTSCGDCVAVCAFKIFEMKSGEVVVNEENLRKCQKDGICVQYCPYKAINIS